MTELAPEVQVKLIEITEKWTLKKEAATDAFSIHTAYTKTFDNIYKQLAKTVSEATSEK